MTHNNPPPARPYFSVHLVLVQDGKVLLMKRQNSFDNNGKYVFIAGKVDVNETPTIALIREAYEEGGITIQPEHVKPLSIIYRTKVGYNGEFHDVFEFFMQATAWTGTPSIMEPDRCTEMTFFPLNHLPENLSDSVTTFLKEQGHNYIEVPDSDWNNYTAFAMPDDQDTLFTKSI